MQEEQVRSLIRRTLKEITLNENFISSDEILSQMQLERENYIRKTVGEFAEKIISYAIENKYPYISIPLEEVLTTLENNHIKGIARGSGMELFL